jgi:hypothetical protein
VTKTYAHKLPSDNTVRQKYVEYGGLIIALSVGSTAFKIRHCGRGQDIFSSSPHPDRLSGLTNGYPRHLARVGGKAARA